MEIDENAPGNVSQSPATRPTDNETGYEPDSLPEADPALDDLINDQSDDPDLPVNPPIDEDEEPSLG
ncbi:hypothetical protein PSCICO_32210 [Pseudomonas cichorii]|uniref:Serine kinase/phosphatase n=1 Tax=Pseudomonas serbiensis TaxID=3064350 RepID=A0ABT9CWA3_9PSED|nr:MULTISPECIES: hypothetical protein [Pseudomonas]MDO7928042.1 hypothetical protein [Pseudomonas sp. KFB-138]GFM83125.1 hypothetical protein PSCICN_38170 [Pseudomonas cichorii]GFM87822.1 hypothetical protein PSCICO_32210 [Pseudomonas cichorii]